MKVSHFSVVTLAAIVLGVLLCAEAGVATSGVSEVVLDPASLNLRVNGRNGKISGQDRVTVKISYSGSTPGFSSCRKVRWIELHALNDDDGGAKDVTLLNRSIGTSEAGTCSFDAAGASFPVTPFSENEIRSFCSGGAGRSPAQGPIRRRIEVLLYGPGEKVPDNRVSLQLVDLYTNVTCGNGAGTLVAENRPAADRHALTPHGKDSKRGASVAPGKHVRDLAAPATAKENLDRMYKELSANYASYVSSYEAYQKKADYCLNKSYTLSDQAAAGCKDADTWHNCKQKIVSVCLGGTPDNLAAAKNKVENDATNLQTEAQKLSEEVPDPAKE